MIEYPKRGPYFAHKTFRLMHKSMVAAELGRDVLCLLAVILHTEDAARYRGPVSYFNSQLIETLGFKKWEQFDAVRTKAIESGWLQYEGCGKRSAGRYFVTIPEGYEQIDDGLMEECISPENGYKQGYDAGYKAGYDEGIKLGTITGQSGGQCGVRSGDKQGEPPISLSLPLNPAPNPLLNTSCSEPHADSKPKRVDEPLYDLEFKTTGKQRIWKPPQSLVDKLTETYETIDVPFQLRAASMWCETNPQKRKTADGMPRMLDAWLRREVNNPRAPKKRPPPQPGEFVF